MEEKTLKVLAKEAKQRLKTGFWQKYKEEVEEKKKEAERTGISVSRVEEYYAGETRNLVKSSVREENGELFYKRVVALLNEYGEREDVLSRLVDKRVLDSLTYEQRQRYYLELSEKYLKALDRYKREKSLGIAE